MPLLYDTYPFASGVQQAMRQSVQFLPETYVCFKLPLLLPALLFVQSPSGSLLGSMEVPDADLTLIEAYTSEAAQCDHLLAGASEEAMCSPTEVPRGGEGHTCSPWLQKLPASPAPQMLPVGGTACPEATTEHVLPLHAVPAASRAVAEEQQQQKGRIGGPLGLTEVPGDAVTLTSAPVQRAAGTNAAYSPSLVQLASAFLGPAELYAAAPSSRTAHQLPAQDELQQQERQQQPHLWQGSHSRTQNVDKHHGGCSSAGGGVGARRVVGVQGGSGQQHCAPVADYVAAGQLLACSISNS